mgnify:CR=1 FL=1
MIVAIDELILSVRTDALVYNAGTPSWGLDQVVLALEADLPRLMALYEGIRGVRADDV